MDENLFFRKTKQPSLKIPNAGSVFKNPANCEFSAGALIDKCGFRGHCINDVQVWENHCNFIVNNGSANSIDYTNLIFEIYEKVKKEYNIELTPEIIFIGEMTEEEKEKWQILKK
jgi:UDP-N-acetylmuramate dehydrogenase